MTYDYESLEKTICRQGEGVATVAARTRDSLERFSIMQQWHTIDHTQRKEQSKAGFYLTMHSISREELTKKSS